MMDKNSTLAEIETQEESDFLEKTIFENGNYFDILHQRQRTDCFYSVFVLSTLYYTESRGTKRFNFYVITN